MKNYQDYLEKLKKAQIALAKEQMVPLEVVLKKCG